MTITFIEKRCENMKTVQFMKLSEVGFVLTGIFVIHRMLFWASFSLHSSYFSFPIVFFFNWNSQEIKLSEHRLYMYLDVSCSLMASHLHHAVLFIDVFLLCAICSLKFVCSK